MEQAAPDKMKVAELRSALQVPILHPLMKYFSSEISRFVLLGLFSRTTEQERGLDTKGTKPVLVARLQEAFDAEKPATEVEVPAAVENMETEAATEEAAKTESMETDEAKPAEDKASASEEKPADTKAEEKKGEKGTKRKADEEPPFEVKENEPEIPEALVCLDWYNSDLNLRITDNYMTGIPFSRFDIGVSQGFFLVLFFSQGWLGILLCWC